MTQDDLTPFEDSPLLHALTSDGTDAELSGESAALAAFQSSAPGRRRRVVRFLGAGVTSVALVGVVGGGVAAAAYTRSLPAPVQDVMHDVLGPIGVPASHKAPSHPRRTVAGGDGSHHSSASPIAVTGAGSPTTAPSGSATTSPGTSASPKPSGSSSPSPTTSATPSASLSASPTSTPTPTITPTPTPTGPVGDPSTWSITAAVSSQVVHVHDSVGISGTLYDAAGQPVPNHRVVVRVHQAGATGWQRAAVRRTDANGAIRGRLDDLTVNTIVVLGAGHEVHSSPVHIVVRPTLSASATPSSDGTSYIVTVTADGGQAGDVIDLLKHTASGWEQVGEATLDSSETATFSVPAPKRQRGYVLRLPATKVHGEAGTRIVLQPLG